MRRWFLFCATSDNLAKQNRRTEVMEENDVAGTRNIHAGREQVHRCGDEAGALAVAEIRDQGLAVIRGHALE
jgi:hypothetical protein